MNLDDLLKQILAILPSASLGEDNDGQVIIYTNMQENENFVLVEMDDIF